MNRLNTTSVSLAVTPTVVSILFSHYLHKRTLKEQPTTHLSYDEGLHLVRSFLEFASHHTVEDLQAFTSQWVPHPQWVKVESETIPDEHLARAAELIQEELGEDGIRQVGGRQWWQWRGPKASLEAEWIEMRSDAHERKKSEEPVRRVMMYIHGGAYFFGSVDEHRYQMQRHARKLKARVFAPRYRLSPQFPFPCGLQDCLATYLHLLKTQDPSTIVLAGDSAGAGMAVALMCLLRDQGLPLPAGGILISPWVDLTHSFPSVAGDAPLDYIPQSGFHHKPSRAWPPPNDDDMAMLRAEADKRKTSEAKKEPHTAATERFLSVTIDGKLITMKDQIQMYTTNALLAHPLVSPVMQPTLGGLPPLLIMVGGGEILRDEQIYLAHKCANPAKYAPADEDLTDRGRRLLAKYKPTDVQLQVWDDLCHVAPTLSFTRPAKYMYRSVAQFGAWALARAQQRGIETMADDDISVITTSGSDTDAAQEKQPQTAPLSAEVGKAGDPLPSFINHMIRQRVTRNGAFLPLPLEEDLPGCCAEPGEVGVIKEGPVRKWLETKKMMDSKYAGSKARVHKKIIKEMVVGYRDFGPGENPPPSALAGRAPVNAELHEGRRKKGIGLAIWSLWGSKHDEMTVVREQKATREPEVQAATPNQGEEARPGSAASQSHFRHRTVHDENQTDKEEVDENTPVETLLAMRREKEAAAGGLLSPDYVPETGVVGKRPFLDGIAIPFSLKNDAETASMLTLNSARSPTPGSRSISPALSLEPTDAKDGAVQPPSESIEEGWETQLPAIETSVIAEEGLPWAK